MKYITCVLKDNGLSVTCITFNNIIYIYIIVVSIICGSNQKII